VTSSDRRQENFSIFPILLLFRLCNYLLAMRGGGSGREGRAGVGQGGEEEEVKEPGGGQDRQICGPCAVSHSRMSRLM